MDGIRDSWNSAEKGVILGSLEFDRVGANPYSGYDALWAIERVKQTLRISDDSVTVVLNYRSNRLNHLSAVWWNHFEAELFRDFICSDNQAEKRWEWIDTSMNPLKLANAYREQGWNVAMIDQEGTSSVGEDVVHALACKVMHDVDCNSGFINDLKNESIDPPSTYDIEDLEDVQRSKLETLLQMRDCYYKSILELDSKFSIVNKKGLWESCPPKDASRKLEELTDTTFFVNATRSILDCGGLSNFELSSYTSLSSNSKTSHSSKSHSTLIIVMVFLSATVIILISSLMQRNRRMHEAKVDPTEGIFRDDPDGSYYDTTEDNQEKNSHKDFNGDNDSDGVYEDFITNNDDLMIMS